MSSFSPWPQFWANAVLVIGLFCLPGIQHAEANDFLPPEEAFQFRLQVQDEGCRDDCLIDVEAVVAPGYYLYRERFALENTSALPTLEFVELPAGEKKFDEFLNQEIEALRGTLRFQIRYGKDERGQAGSPLGALISQGCADAGLCYPPMTTPLGGTGQSLVDRGLASLGVGGFAAGERGETGAAELPGLGKLAEWFDDDKSSQGAKPVPSTLPANEADSLAYRLAEQSWWVVLPLFFGLGLLLAFTPCTLPMLPILSSLIVGQQAGLEQGQVGRARPMALALVYVLGMALTYALLGVLAGLTGQSLVVAMQQPPVLWTFGGVLALLGLALLLGYSLQLPSGFQSWLQEKTGRLKGGQFVPVLVMGVLSALLLGPCVAPPLAGALLYIGQTGDALLGGSALFLLALGMGLPLVLFAAGAGAALPKAGAWMTWVSTTFGFVLLAVAVWTITPVTPVGVVMAAWAVLACLAAAALFHGAATAGSMSSRGKVVAKAAGLLFSLLALIYLMGVFSGSSSLLQPLRTVVGGSTAQMAGYAAGANEKPVFEKVNSSDVMALIKNSPMPVMLDFYADWCVSCKEFELFTLPDATVKARLTGIRLVQVDVTANSVEDQALLKQFRLFGPPAILFFPANQVVPVHQVIGFQNAERFAGTLDQVRPGLAL